MESEEPLEGGSIPDICLLRYLWKLYNGTFAPWNQGTLVFMEVHTGFNQEMNENRIESVNLANKQESFLCF